MTSEQRYMRHLGLVPSEKVKEIIDRDFSWTAGTDESRYSEYLNVRRMYHGMMKMWEELGPEEVAKLDRDMATWDANLGVALPKDEPSEGENGQ